MPGRFFYCQKNSFMPTMNPLNPFLKKYGLAILDGSLASELEHRGQNLKDPLWSAKVLIENPELIKTIHADYLTAGADIITTNSYQANFQGLFKKGLTRKEAEGIFKTSVKLALEARDEFWCQAENRNDRIKPLVAASIGPFGAYLADGSEYSGDYELTIRQLIDFHRPRFETLADAGAGLFAFETIPCAKEAEALVSLLEEYPHIQAWLSFSCRDESYISSGEPIEEAVASIGSNDQVIAAGVNCTPPQYIEQLLCKCSKVTSIPLITYPNSGETWDAHHHCWLPAAQSTNFLEMAKKWQAAGAKVIGGCCRTSPKEIQSLTQLKKERL